MRKGKKALARELLRGTFENVKRAQLQRYHKSPLEKRADIILDPVEILHKAVENATPVMELLKMKRGGVTYQVKLRNRMYTLVAYSVIGICTTQLYFSSLRFLYPYSSEDSGFWQ